MIPGDLRMKQKNLVIIVGPTAVGKTPVAIALAKHFSIEILNADSRQVYREMKIGTNVPSQKQLATVKHHFIGHRSVQEYYNASIFEFEVLELLDKLFSHYDMVLMTGGSGMYVNAVCNSIDDFPTIDPAIRTKLSASFQQHGIQWLRQQVKEVDPVFYSQVDTCNPKRLLKALEIVTMTGQPYSSFLTRQKKEREFGIMLIGLTIEREILYDNINHRVDDMIREGLVEEVKGLIPFRELNALNTVGYKELFDYFDGKITLGEAIGLIKQHTRNYARRQLTWFRRNKEIQWFRPEKENTIIDYINLRTNS
jgi:tRNA dimethylallyltransferase